jgi:hypothetical protein
MSLFKAVGFGFFLMVLIMLGLGGCTNPTTQPPAQSAPPASATPAPPVTPPTAPPTPQSSPTPGDTGGTEKGDGY